MANKLLLLQTKSYVIQACLFQDLKFIQKNSVAKLPTAVEVRPRTRLTSNATTTLSRGVFAYYFVRQMKFGRFQQQNYAKR